MDQFASLRLESGREGIIETLSTFRTMLPSTVDLWAARAGAVLAQVRKPVEGFPLVSRRTFGRFFL
jgi:hypothetical protein